jgi:hypothetical protein
LSGLGHSLHGDMSEGSILGLHMHVTPVCMVPPGSDQLDCTAEVTWETESSTQDQEPLYRPPQQSAVQRRPRKNPRAKPQPPTAESGWVGGSASLIGEDAMLASVMAPPPLPLLKQQLSKSNKAVKQGQLSSAQLAGRLGTGAAAGARAPLNRRFNRSMSASSPQESLVRGVPLAILNT